MRNLCVTLLLALMLSCCGGPQAYAAGLDDETASQRSAPPREFTEWQMADASTPAAPVATVTSVTPTTAPSGFSDFAEYAAGIIASALSAVAMWAFSRVAAYFHIDAKTAALDNIRHVIDEMIDVVRAWSVKEAATLDHNGMVVKVFDLAWPLVKKFVTSLGWTESDVRSYISARLSPETP